MRKEGDGNKSDRSINQRLSSRLTSLERLYLYSHINVNTMKEHIVYTTNVTSAQQHTRVGRKEKDALKDTLTLLYSQINSHIRNKQMKRNRQQTKSSEIT